MFTVCLFLKLTLLKKTYLIQNYLKILKEALEHHDFFYQYGFVTGTLLNGNKLEE